MKGAGWCGGVGIRHAVGAAGSSVMVLVHVVAIREQCYCVFRNA